MMFLKPFRFFTWFGHNRSGLHNPFCLNAHELHFYFLMWYIYRSADGILDFQNNAIHYFFRSPRPYGTQYLDAALSSTSPDSI